jgi:hypothetical protein
LLGRGGHRQLCAALGIGRCSISTCGLAKAWRRARRVVAQAALACHLGMATFDEQVDERE